MKKWIAILTIFALMLTGLVGCKSTAPEEEGAVADEYVEGDAPATDNVEQDVPERVEASTTVDDGTGNTGGNTTDNGDETIPGEEENNTPSNEGKDEGNEPEAGGDEEETPKVNYKEGNLLKIMDYNVRCADDGAGKTVVERAPRLQKLAEQLDPDLMGFQEVTVKWRGLLVEYFGAEYDYVYKERNPGGECTPIFWKKDKFEKMEDGYFWLSETPDVETKGWDADYYRICSWVRLKVKATGTEFLYFNSHWDGSDTVHIGSAQLTLSRARKAGAFSKYAMFLTADFNMLPWGKGYQTLVESGDLSDVNYDLENDSTGTTNGYNEGGNERIIDMCFYSPAKAVPISYRVLNEKIDGGYISDHRGLLIEIGLL